MTSQPDKTKRPEADDAARKSADGGAMSTTGGGEFIEDDGTAEPDTAFENDVAPQGVDAKESRRKPD